MSFTNDEFCDTNVLVYAYDDSAGTKRDVARRLLERLGSTRTGVASIQILQELFVGLTRKLSPPIPPAEARAIVGELSLTWRIFEPTTTDVLLAIDNAAAWQVSFWDAMLLTAADQAGTSLLWSEDLNDGQTYGAVTVRNPFRS
jgi:predicted nucleic acid-binding protein